MNYTTAIFLINPNVRAVLASYEADPGAKREIFKTFDATISVGDLAVVPTNTRHKMTVVKIVETDVDFETDQAVEWVVSKVDRATYDQILADEAKALGIVKAAEIRNKREELAKKLLATNTATVSATYIATDIATVSATYIDGLAICHMGAPVAIEHAE